MTMPHRKPSDDRNFWDGIAVTQANRRFLFDVLALVMADMQRNDGMSPPMSFDQYRETVYGHIDALAQETNAGSSFTKIDNELLKTRLDTFLGLQHVRSTWPSDF